MPTGRALSMATCLDATMDSPPLGVMDSRVDQAVEQIDAKVDEDDERRDHDDEGLHHRNVSRSNGIEDLEPDTGDAEEGFENNVSAEDSGKHQPHRGEDRDHGV